MDLVQISPSSNSPRIQAHQSMEVITAQVPATSPLFSNVLHNLGLGSFIPPDSSFMQKVNCGLLCVLSRYHLIILHVSLLYPFLSSPHTSSPPPLLPALYAPFYPFSSPHRGLFIFHLDSSESYPPSSSLPISPRHYNLQYCDRSSTPPTTASLPPPLTLVVA